MKIAVVGLGVLGASAARALASAGADVTVYERDAPASGTTGTSFAWTNSHSKDPLAYHELNVAGMAEHSALATDPGRCPRWYTCHGNLEWAEDQAGHERLGESVAKLSAREYPVRWIDARHATELVPDLLIPEHVRNIAYYPTEGFIQPALLIARLWGEAADRGAQLRTGAEVVDIVETTHATRLHLADGSVATADAVVLATGRWTETLTSAVDARVPMLPTDSAGATTGFLGYTNPLPARVDHVLTTPWLNVRPDGAGRLVIQGLDLDDRADPSQPPEPDGELGALLLRRLSTVLAGTTGARLTALRVGQRAVPADGLSVAGFLDTRERVYVLATHSGITLGPLLGRLAAHEITTGTREPLLHEFRPERFVETDPDSLRTPSPPRQPGQQ